ncbi:MAG: DNA repair protein RecO [Verrucomicrobia bacterium]|nr:MAG: DNA repair protein RecO [Verrucomicrobiota bacterium]
MDERGHGVVLRVRPLTETSLIVHWLSPEHGRLATVAKGARRPKSSFAGKLDLFQEAEFSFARSRRSDLHTLREVMATGMRRRLRTEHHALEVAAYAVATIEQATEVDTPIPEVAELFAGLLGYLDAVPATARAVFAFELKFLACQGLEPDPGEAPLSDAARELLAELMDVDWMDLATLATTAEAAREVRQFLHGFLIYHLGKLPRGRAEALHAAP